MTFQLNLSCLSFAFHSAYIRVSGWEWLFRRFTTFQPFSPSHCSQPVLLLKMRSKQRTFFENISFLVNWKLLRLLVQTNIITQIIVTELGYRCCFQHFNFGKWETTRRGKGNLWDCFDMNYIYSSSNVKRRSTRRRFKRQSHGGEQ